MKILYCGPIAPPAGGISIHIDRLCKRLIKCGVEPIFCDESRLVKPLTFNLRKGALREYIALLTQADIVHVHSGNQIFRLLHLIAGAILRKRIVLTLHSARGNLMETAFWRVFYRVLNPRLIFVNEGLQGMFGGGVVLPAYIPELPGQADALPAEIVDWLDKRRREGRFIFTANAYRLVDHAGVDLYGLDMCIDAFSDEKLRDNACLVFVIADPTHDTPRIQEFQQTIHDRHLSDTFLLYEGSVPYVDLLARVDGFIRPTNTDGDAVSLREALELGIPSTASDVVRRPFGTFLFKNRDVEDLKEKLVYTMREIKVRQTPIEKAPDTVAAVWAVYNSF